MVLLRGPLRDSLRLSEGARLPPPPPAMPRASHQSLLPAAQRRHLGCEVARDACGSQALTTFLRRAQPPRTVCTHTFPGTTLRPPGLVKGECSQAGFQGKDERRVGGPGPAGSRREQRPPTPPPASRGLVEKPADRGLWVLPEDSDIPQGHSRLSRRGRREAGGSPEHRRVRRHEGRGAEGALRQSRKTC